ncbi:unnamed protein product [Pseudo-nitzschia multistriata]|uniref:1-alkyl-2-acetylglycerophosphocholine esterase n=1 Tax=Pseudo-nitzschia multistriata TaxID=183589 RepID=A0A448Z9D1_9STRA|nr:unnamed protein product [Pseudo-nitzschia multistriata]
MLFGMRLVKTISRKSLLAFGYPKLETYHPELSVYDVGAVKVRMSPELPACQIFYPVEKDSEKDHVDDVVPYYRPEAVEALVDYLNGFGDGIMQMLNEKSHPLQNTYAIAPLMVDSNNGDSMKFPLVLFSHGLSGNMEMYSQICAQLASTGCVVAALEHEDGSASYSTKLLKDGTVEAIPYKQPLPNAEVPYSRKKVLDFRTPMLEQRVNELRRIYNYFRDEKTSVDETITTNCYDSNSRLVRKILAIADPTKLHLVGHSFGGATQLLAAQKWIMEGHDEKVQTEATTEAHPMSMRLSDSENPATTSTMTIDTSTSSSSPPIPQSVMVFDAWNFSLSDEVLNRGISIPSSPTGSTTAAPTIVSVLSEQWERTNPEKEQTLQFLRNCPPSTTYSYLARDSVHQSISDTECYLPSIVARKLENLGPSEERHQTVRAVVEEFVRRTKSSGNDCSSKKRGSDDNTLIELPLRNIHIG